MRKGERFSDWAMGGVGLLEGNNGESPGVGMSGRCCEVMEVFG
jgi:hypothetical protein